MTGTSKNIVIQAEPIVINISPIGFHRYAQEFLRAEESIPTLPIGTCVFSGIATLMPLKLKIEELPDEQKPDSHTLQFEKILEATQ